MTSDDGYFGEAVASTYDEDEADMFAPDVLGPVIDFLAELAGPGPVLEFGVGTGRVALPLTQSGVPVHGIDMSHAMIERLRAKPGADAVTITVGDFANTRVDGSFSLVYLVFNTIMNLTSQAEQVRCFRNAAHHLQPGGSFVIEVMLPELQYLSPGRSIVPHPANENRWGFDIYDVTTQGLTSRYFEIRDGDATSTAFPFRYVWPSELDLMAQLAGLQLRDRWADYSRAPFTSESASHVSVWEKTAESSPA